MHRYKWPDGSTEKYQNWIDYQGVASDGEHRIRIGFCRRTVYGKERERVTVWINGTPRAEFVGADDFDASGEVLSEIRVHGKIGEPMSRYPSDAIPERYTVFHTVGLPTRIRAKGVRGAWAIVANVSDHRTMIGLAALRRLERKSKK